MTKYCEKCRQEFEQDIKKCPVCDSKLRVRYTKEELLEIQKKNDDFTVINMLLM